jgi:hypothetical protein
MPHTRALHEVGVLQPLVAVGAAQDPRVGQHRAVGSRHSCQLLLLVMAQVLVLLLLLVVGAIRGREH